MKTNRAKLFGIIAIVVIIGFTYAACNKVPSSPESDFEVEPIDGGKSVRITKYVGDKGEVGIPSKIQGLPVTHIGDWAFASKELTKVSIPNSVTTIGEDAFKNNQLTSVTIPKSVTFIETATFDDNKLTKVTIPKSVTGIKFFAFSNNQLTSITIPKSVTAIGFAAFSGNQLTSITIGANVELYDSPFGGSFQAVYNNGKAAGTYTRPDTESTTWTRKK